nr:butyrophilin subfamily 3 member A1-like [Chelonoidis abingdonii]
MVMWWQLCVCSLGIFLLAPCILSEKFSLAGSPHPMVVVVGRDVVLPCQLSPPARLPNLEVLWRKIEPGLVVIHEYMNEGTQDLPGEGYQTRTELFPQEFSSGNISLKLKRLQVADAGTYQCLVTNREWTQEASTELQVAAVAPVFIDVLGPQDQGIGLACRSTGWFPKPELQWIGKNWQNLAMEIVTDMTQDRENLYSVVSHVTVTEGEDNGDISCIVRNVLLETERQSAIHLSGDAFPRVSPWPAAFWVIFTLFLIAAGVCAYLGYTAKQKASQKASEEEGQLFYPERTEKTTLESECQELREKLDKALTVLEFRRARSYMVHITLDPDYKHPELTVSEDGRTVQHNPLSPGLVAPFGALIALGREGFVSSRDHGGEGRICRWYWEIEVGDSPDWELGVLSESVRDRVRKERLERLPDGGCWALGRSGGQYHSREADTMIQKWAVTPTVVGVYLDLEGGSLSFYSVSSMTLILEVPVEGSERLFPFLSPGHAVGRDQGKPLSISPCSDWDFRQELMVSRSVSQGNPGAGNNTGPSATGETAPAPSDKHVKENSEGLSVIETVQQLLSTNWIHSLGLGHKTEKEHPQLEPDPKEKWEKKHQTSEV